MMDSLRWLTAAYSNRTTFAGETIIQVGQVQVSGHLAEEGDIIPGQGALQFSTLPDFNL
jgi:hypothetical protein